MRIAPHLFDADQVAAPEQWADRSALQILLEALTSALAHGIEPWEFAVEIDRLLAAGATVEQLRGWADDGLVEHGVETTRPTSKRRTFTRGRNLRFLPGTCFILTAAGAARARNELGPAQGAGTVLVPHWDGRRLRWGDVVVKEYRRPAPNQKLILDTFQELAWVREIDDPLPRVAGMNPKTRLHNTLRDLNTRIEPRLLHFAGPGTGQGVRWDYVGGSSPKLPQ